jgi:hypothetical protein
MDPAPDAASKVTGNTKSARGAGPDTTVPSSALKMDVWKMQVIWRLSTS